MGANIITGYTGTRHITPAMDAAVYRSTFGPDSYILSDGNQLAGSMPSVNEFTVLDGLVSMQGHQIQVTQETLSVDTCANGYKRIDLVCMRFEHDNNSQVDSASLIVIKGTEVADPNDPVVPSYNTGDIDSGASVVDFPLYQIDLAGSSVTFSALAEVVDNTLNGLTVETVLYTNMRAIRSGNVVTIKIAGTASSSTSGWYSLGILDEQFRPSGTVFGVCYNNDDNTWNAARPVMTQIGSSGGVSVWLQPDKLSLTPRGAITYVVIPQA